MKKLIENLNYKEMVVLIRSIALELKNIDHEAYDICADLLDAANDFDKLIDKKRKIARGE